MIGGADLERLRSLDGTKWSKHGSEVLPAWVADMDFTPPPVAIDAIRAVVDRGDLGYNHVARLQLTEAFSAWQREAHGWEPDPEACVLFNDVLHAIAYSIWHATDPGDGIVLLTPIYPPFIKAVEASGRRIVDCPLDPTSWRFDPDAFRAAIDGSTRAVLWCNPHNPTGRAFDADELGALAELVAEHDLLVISDEVWADLVHPGSTHHPAALGPPELAARTITVSAASKSFNLAGLRSAVAHLGPEQIRSEFLAHPAHLRGAVNTLGAEAALACWRHGRPWLDAMRIHLTAQRDHLAERLADELPTVRFVLPDATYLAWLDFRQLAESELVTKRLFDEAGVALSFGEDFGPSGVGFGRLNTATSREILDEIVDRMVAWANQTSLTISA